MKELLKVDRNGSKHYLEECACDRCSGRGWFATGVCNGQLVPSRIDSAICWQCKGSGKVIRKVIERTPEYEAILEKRRQEKAAKKEAERQAKIGEIRIEWLTSHGFTAEGQTFIFLGDTYEKKDEIKALGAKFDSGLGWYINREVEGFHFITANINEVARENSWGYSMTASKEDWDVKKKQALIELGQLQESEHVGEIGQRLKVKVKYVFTASWDVDAPWGNTTHHIHKFVDPDGNIYVWKTTTYVDGDYGTELVLAGTVKEHTEYNGEKQTVLTRCKQC